MVDILYSDLSWYLKSQIATSKYQLYRLRSQFETLKTREENMKQSNDGKINFENIIITPLEKWVDTDFELEQKTVEKLQLLAEKSNQSVDNVLTHFLEDFFSEHLELSKEKTPPKKKNSSKQTQPVANCDQFIREAASI